MQRVQRLLTISVLLAVSGFGGAALAQAAPDYNADAIRERLSGVTNPVPAPTQTAPAPTPATDPACATFEAQMNDPKCFAPAAGGERQLFIYRGGAKPPTAAPAMKRPTASLPTQAARPTARPPTPTRQGRRAPAPAVAPVAAVDSGAAASCVDQVADQALGLNLCVTFALGSAELTPKAKANLDQFAAAIGGGEFATLKFAIEGHADASGSDPKNRELSAQRAESVTSYMVSKGVARDRLTFAGFGSERPVTGQAPTAAVNRRVEARLIR
jgi:outer membrane protein OmpA-like peptidoglycan-associated protein